MRHNVIRDNTAEFMREVSKDVQIEPKLMELTGEKFKYKTTNIEDESRLDVAARNFWSYGTKAFLDIRVFNPLAKSYMNQTLSAAHKSNENAKKREYNQRVIEVEHGCFTPLVFTCFGGMAKECSAFYKHLTMLISEKREVPFYQVSSLIRTKISFSLIKIAIICLRGYRGQKEDNKTFADTEISTTVDDAKLSN